MISALYKLVFAALLYGLLGWCVEAIFSSVQRGQAVRVGVLSLPFDMRSGVLMAVLVCALPQAGSSFLRQFVLTLVASAVVDRVIGFFVRRLCPQLRNVRERERLFSGTARGLLYACVVALVYLLAYHLLQPLMSIIWRVTDLTLVRVLEWLVCVAVLVDIIAMKKAGKSGSLEAFGQQGRKTALADRIHASVWRRLRKAYPGIDDGNAESYVFAQSFGLDKIFWVFLISGLGGDLIETVYCGLVNGEWMNRSSVLYGPFSFVWGLGAVLFTISLMPLKDKNDRWVFGGAFLVGGVFEYLCSVFTELVFGTVFWDYSYLPLNIGGRTCVLFCFFWGIAGLVWIKLLYPRINALIEKIPPLTGKIITWILMIVMLLNALLTMAAMIRYSTRKTQPQPESGIEELLDIYYPDSVIEAHWPNMIVVED